MPVKNITDIFKIKKLTIFLFREFQRIFHIFKIINTGF